MVRCVCSTAFWNKLIPEEHIAIAKQLVQFQQYFANKLKDKENNSTDDIISDLANLDFEDENGKNRKLETAEQLSILQQLLVAGNATAHTITEALYIL